MDSYFSGREMTRPYTSGLYKKDLSFDDLRNMTPYLTVREMDSPFAKYFYEGMAPLQEEMKEGLNRELSENEMYMPKDAGIILLNGSKGYPLNGYGVMENGVGYATTLTHQVGISDEMIKAYRDEFATYKEPDMRFLFYKTWYPGKHLIHMEDAIVENFGWGFCRQDMNWELLRMKEHLGVSHEEIQKNYPDTIALVGLGGELVNIMNPEDKGYTFMVQYTKQTPEGRDLVVHYWSGIHIFDDGTYEVCPNVGRAEMVKRMKGMMEHSMYENCNEIKHIREFWNETRA